MATAGLEWVLTALYVQQDQCSSSLLLFGVAALFGNVRSTGVWLLVSGAAAAQLTSVCVHIAVKETDSCMFLLHQLRPHQHSPNNTGSSEVLLLRVPQPHAGCDGRSYHQACN
jgi:hypothetical protein